jgi:hypothetical protein
MASLFSLACKAVTPRYQRHFVSQHQFKETSLPLIVSLKLENALARKYAIDEIDIDGQLAQATGIVYTEVLYPSSISPKEPNYQRSIAIISALSVENSLAVYYE